MSVVIRMKRMGTTNRSFFRIVAMDKKSPRDGRVLENLGHYDPLKEGNNVTVDKEKALKWLKVGAQPSANVKPIFKREGIVLEKIVKPKKEKVAKKAKPAKAPKVAKKAKVVKEKK